MTRTALGEIMSSTWVWLAGGDCVEVEPQLPLCGMSSFCPPHSGLQNHCCPYLYPNLSFRHGFDSLCFWEKWCFMNYCSSWDFSLLYAEMQDWFWECRFFCLIRTVFYVWTNSARASSRFRGGMSWGQRTRTDLFFYLNFYDHEIQTLLETSSHVMDFTQDDKSWRGTVTECVWLSLVALGPVRDGYSGVGGTSSVGVLKIMLDRFYVALKHSDYSAKVKVFKLLY